MAAKCLRSTAIVVLLMASSANAQTTLDIAKISCGQFANYTLGDPDNIAVWLSGYYAGTRKDTKIDVEQLKQNVLKVKSHCMFNNDENLMAAVEKVLALRQ